MERTKRLSEISAEMPARIGHWRHGRQCTIAVALLLAACGADPFKLAGVTPTAGFVAADEPHAVAVARDILTQGGTAADAATAMGLTLSVTLPSRAGLGGGGACVVRRGREIDSTASVMYLKRETPAPPQSIEFLPRAAHEGAAVGVPSLARGLYALQAKYGVMRWAQLVAPAENMARFGVPVSRALVHDVAAARADITGPTGKPLAEGDLLPQGDLANTLADLRTQGVANPSIGRVAEAIIASSNGEIDAAALRGIQPGWSSPTGVPFGNDVVYFAAGPGGDLAEKTWREVRSSVDRSLYATLLRVVDSAPEAGDPAQRAFAVADAAAAALPLPADQAQPNNGDAATSFVVVDGKGSAVGCSFTMGRLFGAGRILGKTGILASLPVPGRTDARSGAAMLVVNENTRKLIGAFAGGGDRSGPEAMIEVALNVLAGQQSMPAAFSTPRVYAGTPGTLFAEGGVASGKRPATAVAALGSVNAVMCPSGLPIEKPDCVAQSDPRASGVTEAFRSPAPSRESTPTPGFNYDDRDPR
jgi:gamma-glutamyltranspeptidase/glutathione hydrolase